MWIWGSIWFHDTGEKTHGSTAKTISRKNHLMDEQNYSEEESYVYLHLEKPHKSLLKARKVKFLKPIPVGLEN